ncbi:hypothetical protein R1sor_008380 [Riccia sorocarpa]|uniref:Uncharacterized protein n=1 Tax=Riccia sorocarpa TaxID=122646 RepID=A0ABD3HZG4_9MARC
MEQRIEDLQVIANVNDRRQTKQAEKAEFQELKTRSRQLETENRDLTQRYQAVQDKAERLREDIAVRAAKEEELKKRVAHLERESRLAATPVQAQAVTEESKVALEREEKMKEEVSKLQEKNTALEQAKRALEETNHKLQNWLSGWQTLGEQVKKQKSDLDGKEAEWKQKMSDLQKEKDTWETLAASLRLKTAELSVDDVGGLRAEYDRLQRNVEVLEEKQADFIEKIVKPAREEALRLARHRHMLVQELDVAYRQTRMIHQDRWRDFALLGVASFAVLHHPLPEVTALAEVP